MIKTMKDDYVNFEIAKLLKEKGFNEICAGYYNRHGRFDMTLSKVNNIRWEGHYIAGNISAPTLQMAMKWLREVHKLHCDIGYDDLDWFWNIISVSNSIPVEDRPKLLKNGFAGIATYEEACESAIKYCLTNLI